MLLLALTKLVQEGALGTEAVDLFAGHKPSKPHQLTVLYEYSALPPPPVMGGGVGAVELSGVQVFVRAGVQDYPWGDRQVKAVRALLAGIVERPVEVGDSTVEVIALEANGGVMSLGRDSNDCPEFSTNLYCWWRP
jgi:hypothetical protein